MPAAPTELPDALALHRAGRHAEARKAYERLLARRPHDPQVLNLFGLLESSCGRRAEGIALLERSIRLKPRFAEALTNLGNALLAEGRAAEAVTAQERAAEAAPERPEIRCNLGNALQALGRLEEAGEAYRSALALNPKFAQAHNNLGNILKAQGRLEEALASYARAIDFDPAYTAACCNLGNALWAAGRGDEAETMYRRAIELDGRHASSHQALGALLKNRGRLEEAIAESRKALELRPGFVEAHTTLGDAFAGQDRMDEALAAYRKALALKPTHVETLSNLGNVLTLLNRPAEALPLYAQAAAIRPGDPDVGHNEALAFLILGDLKRGWTGYEHRWDLRKVRSKRSFGRPRWNGAESLDGKVLLVHAEQGLGDTLQFVRYLPDLAARGARVLAEVQAPLKGLLAAQAFCADGRIAVFSKGEALPPYDLHVPLLSLPGLLGVDLDALARAPKEPYLRAPRGADLIRPTLAPANLVARAAESPRASFAASGSASGSASNPASNAGRPRIGLVWSGNPAHQNDRHRSVPLPLLARVMEGVPADFFAVQKDIRPADRAGLDALPQVADLSGRIGDFLDSAALFAGLDLVITVDTASAHLTGALGVPTWVLLPFAPDWRWLLDRSDSPWYPRTRLFRQPAIGAWEPVIETVRSELGPWLGDRVTRLPPYRKAVS